MYSMALPTWGVKVSEEVRHKSTIPCADRPLCGGGIERGIIYRCSKRKQNTVTWLTFLAFALTVASFL